jgi:hypothetical protein
MAVRPHTDFDICFAKIPSPCLVSGRLTKWRLEIQTSRLLG